MVGVAITCVGIVITAVGVAVAVTTCGVGVTTGVDEDSGVELVHPATIRSPITIIDNRKTPYMGFI
jgi:hypothetical protein